MENEQELILRAKSQDSTAFSMLMQRHANSLYKVAKAILKNDEDVADAMQETALSCWQKIETLQNGQYFKTWLIRILINHCNTIRRKKSRYVLSVLLPEEGAEENAYANAEWMELLSCLGEKYRIVIVLFYVEGFRIREIADLLSISESAVKERLSSARKKLARCLTSQPGPRRRRTGGSEKLRTPVEDLPSTDFHRRMARDNWSV